MRIVKHIKWPSWIVLILFFTLLLGTIYHFTNTKTETYDEDIASLHQAVSNQGEKPHTKQELAQEEVTVQQTEPEEQENVTEQKELDPSGKYVAFTFDDGPHPNVTPRILQTLKEYNIKSTFFMLGNQVEKYPDIAKQVADNGHEIGNHTYNHPNLRKLSNEEMMEEIRSTNEIITLTTGEEPTLLRPPYGIYTNEVLNYATTNGYSTILWSVDSLDWKSKDASAINSVVTQHTTNGSIVLMHDIYAETADALPQLIQSLQMNGYEFITVSELLSIQQPSSNGTYFGAGI